MITAAIWKPSPEQSAMLQNFNAAMNKLSPEDRAAIYAGMESAMAEREGRIIVADDGTYLGTVINVPNGTTGIIPEAILKIECQMMNPPKPIGCHVVVNRKSIAVVTLDELKSAMSYLQSLEEARER